MAVRETLGEVLVGQRVIPASAIAGRAVTELAVPELVVADFTADEAPTYGIVPSDASAPRADNYETTRLWAQTIDVSGFEAIQSRSRFGTGHNPRCLYVFGSEGQHRCGATGETLSMSDVLADMLEYTIDPTPHSDELIVEDGHPRAQGG